MQLEFCHKEAVRAVVVGRQGEKTAGSDTAHRKGGEGKIGVGFQKSPYLFFVFGGQERTGGINQHPSGAHQPRARGENFPLGGEKPCGVRRVFIA